jgi:hypothetical protein
LHPAPGRSPLGFLCDFKLLKGIFEALRETLVALEKESEQGEHNHGTDDEENYLANRFRGIRQLGF